MEHVAQAHRATASIDYRREYPVLINDRAAARYAEQAITNVLGAPGLVAGFPPLMAAEDFAFMLEERPDHKWDVLTSNVSFSRCELVVSRST